jgi:hypothetical protein
MERFEPRGLGRPIVLTWGWAGEQPNLCDRRLDAKAKQPNLPYLFASNAYISFINTHVEPLGAPGTGS